MPSSGRNLLKDGWDRQTILMAIEAEGIPGLSGSCSEVYLEKAFDQANWRPKHRLPVARELGETSLMFLVHPTLTAEEIADTCRVVEKVLAAASRSDRLEATHISLVHSDYRVRATG